MISSFQRLPLDAVVTGICLCLSSLFYALNQRTVVEVNATSSQGYILSNQVTHARLLPVEASNKFNYPTLSLLLSLNALEARKLDLCQGWIFSYGGLFLSLVGIRSTPYLTDKQGDDRRSIKDKLATVLKDRGVSEKLEDAWMMTMPSFLGFEGINPLTVYFCYDEALRFRTLVLEIHNTFGETQVHLLRVGVAEDDRPPKGFDHQWTFPREFHVSPFNDRSGFYVVSIKVPTHPPTIPPSEAVHSYAPPRPTVRVHLHTSPDLAAASTGPSKIGPLKLTAILRPTESTPLRSSTLLRALSLAPFALFLALPRIFYQAGILHYRKRLDVYLRPELVPPVTWGAVDADSGEGSVKAEGGAVKWLKEGALEKYARHRISKFLRKRADALSIRVQIIPADPTVGPTTFDPPTPARDNLRIHHLSPRFYIFLLLSPSIHHAALIAGNPDVPPSEREFFVSSQKLLDDVFQAPIETSGPIDKNQQLRICYLPSSYLDLKPPLSIPTVHYLDASDSPNLKDKIVLRLLLALIYTIEPWAFKTLGARIVQGKEPWTVWERAAARLESGISPHIEQVHDIGSVRRGV